MKKLKIILIAATSVFGSGCKKPYDPPAVAANGNYLVVEGLINSGTDSTFIKLNRTIKLSSKSAPKSELNAIVSVESSTNSSYPLQELGGGIYGAASLNLPASAKYRLRIKTSDNKEYLSDFVETKTTPGIDSIPYNIQNNGVQFFVNAHDDKNSTIYYKWDFDETWQYVSYYYSYFKDVDNEPVIRFPQEQINSCYKTDQSHQVLLGTTAKLGKDVIFMQPINFVDAASGKISYVYSVQLRQYALTADAYNYWQILKKNTEQLGSIFDAQPSTAQGNIHCTSNPGEPIIGYISASTISRKRIYVDHFNNGLYTPAYVPPPDIGQCPLHHIPLVPLETFPNRFLYVFGTGDTLLVNQDGFNGVILGYSYAAKNCVDCTQKA
ncbi:MAG: DUF4249 domain-containing protein, partial [Mucilaginibacter sp.]